MSPHRRAGALRLIEWTADRCVPGATDGQLGCEDLHRYLWAARVVEGRRVLEVASGDGLGAAILAKTAESVHGIEIDPVAVEQSRLDHVGANLRFELGEAEDLSRFEDRSFGAVVAFGIFERVAEPERVMAEITRVLAPDGVAIISMPARAMETGAAQEHASLAAHELSPREFERLLRGWFAHVRLSSQRAIVGSAIVPVEPVPWGGAAPESAAAPAGGELLALASHGALPPAPTGSFLANPEPGQPLVHYIQRSFAEAQTRLEARLEARARDQERLRKGLAARDAELESVRAELDALRPRLAEAESRAARLSGELTDARAAIWRIGRVMGANTIENLRGRIYYRLGGPGAPGVRAVQAILRVGGLLSGGVDGGGGRLKGGSGGRLGRGSGGRLRGRSGGRLGKRPGGTRGSRTTSGSAPAAAIPGAVAGPIELTVSDHPEVSIVVPLHARADLTRRCLASIAAHTRPVRYEVILIDDAADQATKRLLAEVQGARLISNPENIGYLRSVNSGAAAARGSWLLLANNDIEVSPGWLSSMLDCAAADPQVAIVTPRYLYPDGSLAEAGGIIWSDGSGWNYGRGEDPADPRYAYHREVDYGSAAALLVRLDLWKATGGFDERYLPMYFEDVDLCFEARERGLKVVYDPGSTVVHHEGASAGTDISSGPKRHQALNRPKFVEKWGHRLEREHRPPDPRRVRDAANRQTGPHVLVIDHRVPMWDRDSGSLRMLGILQALLGLGCRVSFLPDNLHPMAPYTAHLQRLGVEVLHAPVDVEAAMREMSASVRLALLCRPESASRWMQPVRRYLPNARVVYDTVDLHWLREVRRDEARAGRSGGRARPGATAVALREMETGLFRAADATVVVTDDEGRLVAADAPGKPIFVVPNVHRLRVPVPPLAQREGVLFIGGFEHPPNVEAAQRLIERLMPAVWERLGGVPLQIVGGSVPPQLRRAASGRVEITGWLPEVDPLLDRARVLVAPMTYGAGLKGKVTQAMAAGLPVVTTTIGAEGLAATDGHELLIADDDEGLAERVLQVLEDDALWDDLSAAGQDLVDRLCSPGVIQARLIALFASLRCPVGTQPVDSRLSHSEPPPSA
jgi:GT2 family glycosyltransferase/SAM-dependent methyltransferase